ncbi:RidA family protein [Reichenbachiella sp. MSK19-1]|uniref:RidA family protein n=1 Tax=Reichenbachiella sp. MSK19-1 TaxID=1897631 RepID=UPI000E6BC2D8|nr:RidA family protein [Reichenbachiella sp. MSK19-1]RJE71623.1 acetyltransferase [Reichenbachiella sp. MSK19-1]
MIEKRIVSGSSFEKEIGYARAVVDTHYIHVSGTTGYNYSSMTISEDIIEQAEQCLENIQQAIHDAGSSMNKIVRVRYILPNREDFEPCWPILRQYFGNAQPAATMIVAGLADAKMKIEIEVTALR